MGKALITGQLGLDTQLSYGDAVGGPFTELAGIIDHDVPGGDSEKVQTTDMDATTSESAVSGELEETGDYRATIKFDVTQHNALVALVGLDKFFQVAFPDGTTWIAPGFLAGAPAIKANMDGLLIGDITVKVTDAPTFTPAV